jgi:hypothetical protein
MKVVIVVLIAIVCLTKETNLSKRDIIGEAFNNIADPGSKAVSYNETHNDKAPKLPSVNFDNILTFRIF